jgi:hypothetical protein
LITLSLRAVLVVAAGAITAVVAVQVDFVPQ